MFILQDVKVSASEQADKPVGRDSSGRPVPSNPTDRDFKPVPGNVDEFIRSQSGTTPPLLPPENSPPVVKPSSKIVPPKGSNLPQSAKVAGEKIISDLEGFIDTYCPERFKKPADASSYKAAREAHQKRLQVTRILRAYINDLKYNLEQRDVKPEYLFNIANHLKFEPADIIEKLELTEMKKNTATAVLNKSVSDIRKLGASIKGASSFSIEHEDDTLKWNRTYKFIVQGDRVILNKPVEGGGSENQQRFEEYVVDVRTFDDLDKLMQKIIDKGEGFKFGYKSDREIDSSTPAFYF